MDLFRCDSPLYTLNLYSGLIHLLRVITRLLRSVTTIPLSYSKVTQLSPTLSTPKLVFFVRIQVGAISTRCGSAYSPALVAVELKPTCNSRHQQPWNTIDLRYNPQPPHSSAVAVIISYRLFSSIPSLLRHREGCQKTRESLNFAVYLVPLPRTSMGTPTYNPTTATQATEEI